MALLIVIDQITILSETVRHKNYLKTNVADIAEYHDVHVIMTYFPRSIIINFSLCLFSIFNIQPSGRSRAS